MIRGFIEFTYCDHDAEQFVALGRTATMDVVTLRDLYDGLAAPNDPDSAFLADLWADGEHHYEDRVVSAAEVERVLGRGLDALLADVLLELANPEPSTVAGEK